MKLNIDWAKVESRFKYAAMDSSGKVYLYEDLPCLQNSMWDSGGNYISLGYHAASVGEPNWEETLTERPTEKTEMSAQNNTHLHAAIIAEAIKDTSRKIQCRYKARGIWVEISLDDVVKAPENWEFRFADTASIVTSPLTDDELIAIWDESGNPLDACRTAAIAAKVATLKEVAVMPLDTSLLNNYSARGYGKSYIIRSACNAVEEFKVKLLKRIGEQK